MQENQETLFPRCELCLAPFCRLLHTQFCWTNAISRVVWVGCQSHRAMAHCRFYRRDELGPCKKDEWRTRGVLSPHPLSLPPSVYIFCRHQISWLFHFQRVSTYTDENAAEGTILQWSNSDFDYIRAFGAVESRRWAIGRKRKAQSSWKSDASHRCTVFRDNVKLFCDISNPLPLFSVLSSHLHVCFSLAVLSFCAFPQCLHFEPNSINLSGKLQMFWVNYVNHGEIKLQKARRSCFIS